MSYKYYDTPVGHDVHKKLWVATKVMGPAAAFFSTIDVMMYSHPKGYLQILGRYLYVSTPFMGGAYAFTITQNAAASLRKKDDYINSIIGALAASAVVGTWRRCFMSGFNASIFFTAGACSYKYCVDHKIDVMPEVRMPQQEHAWTLGVDWSLTKPRKGNWTTGKEE